MKRSEHIVRLSKDHHFALLFCWKIRHGLKSEVEAGRIIRYVQYFWQQHLQPHFQEEEAVLFAPMKDSAVQQALEEHATIAHEIKALNSRTENLVNQLSKIADMVDNHVRYEERVLFPHLETALTSEQLVSVGKQLAAHLNPALKDDFADEFWLKNKNGL